MTTKSGDTATREVYIWLTSNIHKIRIVIDGNTGYVNTYRLQILEALREIMGTGIVWIDSVGHYTKDGSIDVTK